MLWKQKREVKPNSVFPWIGNKDPRTRVGLCHMRNCKNGIWLWEIFVARNLEHFFNCTKILCPLVLYYAFSLTSEMWMLSAASFPLSQKACLSKCSQGWMAMKLLQHSSSSPSVFSNSIMFAPTFTERRVGKRPCARVEQEGWPELLMCLIKRDSEHWSFVLLCLHSNVLPEIINHSYPIFFRSGKKITGLPPWLQETNIQVFCLFICLNIAAYPNWGSGKLTTNCKPF